MGTGYKLTLCLQQNTIVGIFFGTDKHKKEWNAVVENGIKKSIIKMFLMISLLPAIIIKMK